MGKSTISMAIFNSYFSLPEGNYNVRPPLDMFVGLDSPQELVRYKYHKSW